MNEVKELYYNFIIHVRCDDDKRIYHSFLAKRILDMLRTLFKSDLAQLLVIENAVHITPWPEDTFKTCFDAGYLGWVIEHEKKVVAFIMISLRVEECHILNLGVAREFQGQGFGRQLMEYVLKHAKRKGAGIVYLEVRRSNSRAIGLYQRMNFQQIGERKGYYPTVSGNEDALIFAKSLVDG